VGIRRSNLGRGDIARDANWLRPFLPAIGGDTYRVRVSADDTTPDYLEAKVTSADGSVVISVVNDGADEDLDLSVAVYVAGEIGDHADDPDAHHNQVHVLATTAGLGADHTVSGLTAGQVLRATSATTAAFASLQATDLPTHVIATNVGLGSQHSISGATAGHVLRASGATAAAFAQLQHSDLGGVGANDHHNQQHALVGSDHTASGLTTGHVLRATDATTFAFAAIQATDLPNHVLATTAGLGGQHTVSGLTAGQVLRATGATTAAFASLQATDLPSHVLATNTALGSQHTISGATAGHVLRASGATTAAFAQLQHSDLGGVGANDHHNQSHVLATTSALGPDHTVSGLTSGQVLKATSATAARFIQLLHSELGSIGANDHHNQSHSITSASDHTVTGAALDVVGLSATNTLGILTPSASPGAASALLKSDTSGYLTLVRSIVNGAAGTARVFQWQTGGVARWDLRANSTAESGSNAGSDLQLFAYADAGTFLSTAMQVTRATGYVNFPGTAVQVTALGVGVSPSVPIHISSTSNEMIRLSHSSSGSPFIAFYTDSLRHGYLQANTNNTVYLAAEYGSLVFQTGSAGTASTRVTIEDDGDVVFTNSVTVGGDLTITTSGNQGDRFLMENSSVSGSTVFYDFNQTDRDAGSTGAFELGFYRDANNITEVRMSKEVFEVIIRSGGTYRFPLEVRAQQVILAELPTSNPGIVGALYRSGGTVLIST